MSKHFFDSVGEEPAMVLEYERKAATQDDRALEFILNNPDLEFTNEDIHKHVMPEAPETSPRRACSTLKLKKYIEKVGKKNGKYGKKIVVWRLRKGQQELAL